LPYTTRGNVITDRDDLTHHFMSWHKGVRRHTPFVLVHGQVRLADAAIFDRYFYLFFPQSTRSIFDWLKYLSFVHRGMGMDFVDHEFPFFDVSLFVF
jgi:hypothetical protein